MNKIILFLVVVIVGAMGGLILLNQNPKEKTPLADFPNPTFAPITPSLQPEQATQQPTNPQAVVSPTNTIVPPETTATKTAIIKTSKGDITLILYGPDAPRTVGNFVAKAKSGFYNNLIFHRAEDWVVQGGDPLGNGTGGGNMPVEFNSRPFVVGAVGVASRGDGKVQNDSQFFITKKDASWLNGQYANFGMVTNGMEVVEKLEKGDKISEITIE